MLMASGERRQDDWFTNRGLETDMLQDAAFAKRL
jgi:hypothetical protein